MDRLDHILGSLCGWLAIAGILLTPALGAPAWTVWLLVGSTLGWLVFSRWGALVAILALLGLTH